MIELGLNVSLFH